MSLRNITFYTLAMAIPVVLYFHMPEAIPGFFFGMAVTFFFRWVTGAYDKKKA